MESSSAPARCGLRNRSGPTWRQWCRSWGIGRSRRVGSFGRVRKPGLSAENHHDSAGPRFLEFFGSKGASSCNEGTASGIALMGSSSAPARRGLRNRSGPTWRQWCRSWPIGKSRRAGSFGRVRKPRAPTENHHDSAGAPVFGIFRKFSKARALRPATRGLQAVLRRWKVRLRQRGVACGTGPGPHGGSGAGAGALEEVGAFGLPGLGAKGGGSGRKITLIPPGAPVFGIFRKFSKARELRPATRGLQAVLRRWEIRLRQRGMACGTGRHGLRNRSGPTWRRWCRSWGIGRSRCVWAPGAGGERRGLWAESGVIFR